MMRKSHPQSIYILGAGRCGRALATALIDAGHSVVGMWNRSAVAAETTRQRFPAIPVDVDSYPADYRGADIVWITVPDRHIAEAAVHVVGVRVVLHASGALPADVLRHPSSASAVAAVHPIQSFPTHPVSAEHMHGVFFGLQGDDSAVTIAENLVTDMRGTSLRMSDATEKALYHAACCVASNALVALMERAIRLFSATGVTRDEAFSALLPLVLGTLDNMREAREPLEAMTGPIARGDTQIIAAHLDAIRESAPSEASAYDQLVEIIASTLRRGPSQK